MVRPLRRPPLIPGKPPEFLVVDEPCPCPYLPVQTARLPLRLPARPLTRHEISGRLREGDRREGMFLYRPACDGCRACEAIRIDVNHFRPSKTQRRVFRRGEAMLTTEVAAVSSDAEKVALYNRHKRERGLLVRQELIDEAGYEQFLVDSCADTFELRYRLDGKLVGVAINDRGDDALSAVYCYYDPDYAKLSLGAYSILKAIHVCRTWGLPYLYLGLYIAACNPMRYKATYFPHERLIDGAWQRFAARS
jgi:arginine-tRNA-protein transferase